MLWAPTTNNNRHVLRKNFKNPPKILWLAIFFPFSLNKFFRITKNLAYFSLLDNVIFFQKYEFFIWFFCKNPKNSVFREKKFHAEIYTSKIAIIFFSVRYPVEKPSCRRFLKSLQNHTIFEFFFCFPYEARHSAIFHRRRQKCMSGNSSALPVLESVRFKKQTLIFNVIFEKKVT